MRVIGQCLDKIEFTKYVKDYSFGIIPPNRIVLHHTWKPTKVMWNGKHSIQGLKTYYEKKGWPTGPHLFIAEDGIWLFTPMFETGIHAGKGNATYESKFSNTRRDGYIGNKGSGNWKWSLESYSIGIEMVGNYDSNRPDGKTWDNTLHVIKTLTEELKMPHDAVKFHRDYSPKTCPGAAVTKEWVYKELEDYGKTKPPLIGVPKYFKENFVWNPSEQLTHDEVVKMIYKYHKTFNKNP